MTPLLDRTLLGNTRDSLICDYWLIATSFLPLLAPPKLCKTITSLLEYIATTAEGYTFLLDLIAALFPYCLPMSGSSATDYVPYLACKLSPCLERYHRPRLSSHPLLPRLHTFTEKTTLLSSLPVLLAWLGTYTFILLLP